MSGGRLVIRGLLFVWGPIFSGAIVAVHAHSIIGFLIPPVVWLGGASIMMADTLIDDQRDEEELLVDGSGPWKEHNMRTMRD